MDLLAERVFYRLCWRYTLDFTYNGMERNIFLIVALIYFSRSWSQWQRQEQFLLRYVYAESSKAALSVFAVERLLVYLLFLVGVALNLLAFLQPSALSWASSLTWGRRSVSDCFMYAPSPMQHSASAGLTLKVIPFSSFSHIDWKLRAKQFGMQEGPGASVMSAYVELVFDNTDRRLPVSTITAPRKESIDLIKLLCASHLLCIGLQSD